MPDKQVGEELRKFFLELLEGTNLREYHENRGGYINRRRIDNKGFLSDRAAELLQSDALVEIEESIMLVTGSGPARPIWVISPPF